MEVNCREFWYFGCAVIDLKELPRHHPTKRICGMCTRCGDADDSPVEAGTMVAGTRAVHRVAETRHRVVVVRVITVVLVIFVIAVAVLLVGVIVVLRKDDICSLIGLFKLFSVNAASNTVLHTIYPFCRVSRF